MLSTPFTELVGCTVPVQQAAMGPIAPARMAAAVANAGGLGMISGVLVPPATLARTLDELAATARGPVGVNWIMPYVDREGVEVAAAKARVVEFFYGDPDPGLVELGHRGGALVCWQVGSPGEARAAEAAGCDLIVAQGMEAGGHVRGRIGLLPLLAEVCEHASIPVVAAGGIATGRAMAGALATGAAAVRMGTRFVCAEEAHAHPVNVEKLLEAGADDTEHTDAFSVLWQGAPHRVLRSALEAARAFEGEFVGELHEEGESVPIRRFDMRNPTADMTGVIEAMALYAGQGVGMIRDVRPAAEIVRGIAADAERILRAWR